MKTYRQDIQFVVGRLKGEDTTTVQTVLFDKEKWTEAQAKEWLESHDMRADKVDETEGRLRFRQREPGDFEEDSLRTVEAGENKQDKKRKMGEFDLYAEFGTLYELNDVEIFRAGTWNGDTYTEEDLDEIVRAFDRQGFRPPVKLGHAEASGSPAFGWVKSLRRKGDKLVADLMDLPEKVFGAIKERQFDTVSSEIFWNLKRGKETFKRALKAVALLGAEVPAVSGLKPLRENFADTDAEARAYSLSHDDLTRNHDPEEAMKLKELQDENAKLREELETLKEKGGEDEEVKKLQASLKERDKRIEAIEEARRQEHIDKKVDSLKVPAYKDMVRACYEMATEQTEKQYTLGKEEKAPEAVVDALVDRINQDAEHLFRIHSQTGVTPDPGSDDPQEEVDRRTRKYMREHEVESYSEALEKVLEEDPELKAKYAQ